MGKYCVWRVFFFPRQETKKKQSQSFPFSRISPRIMVRNYPKIAGWAGAFATHKLPQYRRFRARWKAFALAEEVPFLEEQGKSEWKYGYIEMNIKWDRTAWYETKWPWWGTDRGWCFGRTRIRIHSTDWWFFFGYDVVCELIDLLYKLNSLVKWKISNQWGYKTRF